MGVWQFFLFFCWLCWHGFSEKRTDKYQKIRMHSRKPFPLKFSLDFLRSLQVGGWGGQRYLIKLGKGIIGQKWKNLPFKVPRHLLFTILPRKKMNNGKEGMLHFFAKILFHTVSPSPSSSSVHSQQASGGKNTLLKLQNQLSLLLQHVQPFLVFQFK